MKIRNATLQNKIIDAIVNDVKKGEGVVLALVDQTTSDAELEIVENYADDLNAANIARLVVRRLVVEQTLDELRSDKGLLDVFANAVSQMYGEPLDKIEGDDVNDFFDELNLNEAVANHIYANHHDKR